MVTADFDDDAVADPPVAIAHAVAGADYEGLTVDDTVTVTIAEMDTAGIWVEKTAVALDEGATAAWKVALDTEPSEDVTVTPQIPAGADATVTPASVTFTPRNYESPKTFTLTAVHDDDAVDDAAFMIGHAATGGDYEGLAGPGVEVTVTDDDEPGLAVTPDPLAVPEGGSAAFMVRLVTEPSTQVTVTAARKTPVNPDVTVTPATRTFNATNWNQAKPFTVAGAADADADDDEQVVVFSASGGEYAGAATVEATARVEDDDKPSSEVRLSVAPAGVAEDAGGAAVTVTAALDAAPRLEDTAVTVSVGAGTGAGAASASDFAAVPDFVVTIDAGATSAAAEFTLAPVDDDDYEGDETLSVSGSTSASGFTVAGTEVAILEDDVRGIALSTTAVTVVEAAVGESYGVWLATRPTGNVTVLAEVPGGTDVRVSPAAGLVFDAASWNTRQLFTVSAVDDADSTADAVVTVTHRVAGADYETVAVDAAVAVTITENDIPGVGVTPTALEVSEGADAGYTVVLATQPTGPVTVTATVPAGHADVSVAPASRTFTRDDWYTPKGFTVAHAGDDDGVDDAAVAIGHDATGGGYGPVAIDAVTATFADPDTAGLVFVPAAVTVIEQDPDGASYTVALATEPTGDVTVTVTAPPGAVYVHTTSFVTSALTFTPSDWDTAQTVNVDALHDNNADDERLTLSHAVTGGDYTAWALAAPPGARSVALDVVDNDIASTAVTLTVAPAEVAEDAGASAVTVTGMLDGVPRGTDTTVTVTVSAGSGAGGASTSDFEAVGAFTLTIAAGSRSGTAGFTFTPVDDDVDEGDETAIVGGSAPGLAVVAAELAIGEDDARGIVLSKTQVTVTEEDGAGASYTVALTSEPTGPVTVFADPPAGSGVRIAPPSLTFPAADWDDPQTFTVSAVHDADGMDETGLAIAHRVAGADYAGHGVADTVAVTIVDDDIRDVVVSALSAAIAEGESATYTVKLNTQPSDTVTVTLTPAPDNSELILAPASLAFDTNDWETAQTVTVTASHDDDAIADPPFAIAHAASGGDYAGVVSSTDPLEVTVTEDDMEGFAVVPSALTIAEEATGTFTVALTSAPAGTVEVEAAVSGGNEVTVTPAALVFDASDWDDAQTFTVAAGDDTDSDDDTATVTVRVKSGSYGAPAVPVAVTVDDNDDPSTKVTLNVAPAGVAEDAGASAVTVTGMLDGAPRGDDTQVIVTVSDGPIQSRAEADEFEPVSAFVLTIAAGSRTGTAQFTFTPVDNDVDGPDRKVSVYGAIVGSSISVEPVELLILDDDTRGIAVTPSSVTVTEEDGAGASYTVRLESQPTGSVTVHADPPAGTAVRVAPASRTFTPTTWNTPQAFTVSAVHDADSVDETSLAIAHRVTGADYQGDTVDATVAVTVIDDDIPGIHVVPATSTRSRMTVATKA